MADTKIGLPENRKRLKGAGITYEKGKSFDEGYNAGFDAGIAYAKSVLESQNNGR